MVRQFRKGYHRSLRQTRMPKAALAQELDIVASQRPFDVLTKDELDVLTDLFAPLPDPTVLGDVLEEARRTGDISILRDRAALERFVEYVAGQQGREHNQAPAPVAEAGA